MTVEMAKSSGKFLGQKKQKKSPPASFERNSCFDFHCERAIDFRGPPRIPEFDGGNPKGRHVSVERRPKQGEDVLLKIRKYLSAQRGKNVLLG